MRKIRVLIIDDSVVIRRLVSAVFGGDPAFEVVGTAANGRIGLQKIIQCSPDVITLDMEMPEMDGLETLKHLQKDYPKLPVVMFSTLTQKGAVATLEALALGASDYVTKPANVGAINEGLKQVEETLIPKIKALVRFTPDIAPAVLRPAVIRDLLPATASAQTEPLPVTIVAIGCSTGGPNALAEVISALPGEMPVPIVITQHMPPMFTRSLADRLNAKSPLTVVEAEAGMELKPGWVYIAPGNYHMTIDAGIKHRRIQLNQDPPENSCRPAVDVMMRSVVKRYGSGVCAVILTGMGQDGLRGCREVRDVGGYVIAQDEASSVVWGMPGLVAQQGLAHQVLPLSKIPGGIVRAASPSGSMAVTEIRSN